MKRLLTTLVVLTGLFGAGGAVWAQDYVKGSDAYRSGDFATALKEWKPLAEQGDAEAQQSLGVLYALGNGVTQDDAEAVKWFRKAAQQGFADAQIKLAFMYFNGNGDLQDTIAAHMWFNIAAANGNTHAAKARDIVAGKLSSSDILKAQQKANGIWLQRLRLMLCVGVR
jgi:TPR repeat protein